MNSKEKRRRAAFERTQKEMARMQVAYERANMILDLAQMIIDARNRLKNRRDYHHKDIWYGE